MTPKEEFNILIRKKKGEEIDEIVHETNFIYSWGDYSYDREDKDIRTIIDFARLFLECPSYPDLINEDEYYGLDWSKHSSSSANASTLAIFIVSLFLSSMLDIIHSGLKRDYVVRNENLKAKVKGRVLHSYNIRKNIIPGYQERFFCAFQEYTEDIPINRLLKATLILARNLIDYQAKISDLFSDIKLINDYHSRINLCLSHMQKVGLEPNPYTAANVVSIPHGKLFKNYEKAGEFARLIIQLNSTFYRSKDNDSKYTSPDFWIYLPTLFEHYIYGKMNIENKRLYVQPKGVYGQRADFILRSPDLVIDAKFKPRYLSTSPNLEDFRELSGYARDELFFPGKSIDAPCIIVYPITKLEETLHSNEIPDDIKSVFSPSEFNRLQPIPGMRSFYKVGILLPCVEQPF